VEEGKFYTYTETPLFCIVICLKNVSDEKYLGFDLKVLDVLDKKHYYFIGNIILSRQPKVNMVIGGYGLYLIWNTSAMVN
jgi:hypothetical protein